MAIESKNTQEEIELYENELLETEYMERKFEENRE